MGLTFNDFAGIAQFVPLSHCSCSSGPSAVCVLSCVDGWLSVFFFPSESTYAYGHEKFIDMRPTQCPVFSVMFRFVPHVQLSSSYNPWLVTTSTRTSLSIAQHKIRRIPFFGVGQNRRPKSDTASLQDFGTLLCPSPPLFGLR
ncbi:hypothetical protein BFJ71_g13937 [Fusarium oxysporum]|nr:hypothetical protein BFJ71_g13937 [Fusarium oxysporum]